MSDIPSEDPKNTTSYRLARAAVILLGVLLAIAFVALVVGLAMRMSGHGPNAAMAQAPASFTLAKGARIVSLDTEPGRVVMHIRSAAGDEVDIIDTENGRLVAQIKAPALDFEVIAAALLPSDLREQIAREAHAAFPRECCGLIEGVREGETVRALALHPARNLAESDDRFEIDPKAQFDLLRALRGTVRDVVGCYHSHPGGRPEPSARDRDGAGEEGFVWLIAAVEAGEVRLAAHLFESPGFRAIPLRLAPARAATL